MNQLEEARNISATSSSSSISKTHRAKQVLQSGAPWLWSVLILVALVLFVRILWAPVEIGSPANESEALTRANERLLEMVKWTLSTILTIGGALIGLNWYQSTRRYEHDREALNQVREENDERWNRQERYFDQQVQSARAAFGMIEEQIASRVTEMVRIELQELNASSDGPEPDSDTNKTARDVNRSGPRAGLSALWDNITTNQAGKRITQEVNRFLTPYPFGDMKTQRNEAVRTIAKILRSARQTGTAAEDLEALGASDAWKLFPLVVADFPGEARHIESDLRALGVKRDVSATTEPEETESSQQ